VKQGKLSSMRMTMLAVVLGLSLPALAQDVKPLVLSQVPKQGQAPGDFVPAGWKIEETIRGDLDKTGGEDTLLQLVEDKPANDAEGVPTDRARALLALLAEGGKLKLGGASNKVLYCTTCAGTLGGTGEGLVKIVKGVVLVDQLSGSRESTHTLLRFRHDAKERRFQLIGEDVDKADRGEGTTQKVSTNLLTGQRVTESLRYDSKQDKDVPVSSKKSKVAVKKVYLEDVDISTY